MKKHKDLGIQFDAELEWMYQTQKRQQHDLEKIVLGDAFYGQRFKMPKYNGPVTMLAEPKVAVRYANTLRIPTSKAAHSMRAEHFRNQHNEIENTYHQLVKLACDTFGDHGPLVSGIVHDHFPQDVKDRLRFLSTARNLTGDATRLHDYLSKTRSPLFS
jgi:hypothetical protein